MGISICRGKAKSLYTMLDWTSFKRCACNGSLLCWISTIILSFCNLANDFYLIDQFSSEDCSFLLNYLFTCGCNLPMYALSKYENQFPTFSASITSRYPNMQNSQEKRIPPMLANQNEGMSCPDDAWWISHGLPFPPPPPPPPPAHYREVEFWAEEASSSKTRGAYISKKEKEASWGKSIICTVITASFCWY